MSGVFVTGSLWDTNIGRPATLYVRSVKFPDATSGPAAFAFALPAMYAAQASVPTKRARTQRFMLHLSAHAPASQVATRQRCA